MKIYSNISQQSPQPWKTPGTWAIFFNEIDHGEEAEGNRFEYEMIVVDDLLEETITAAKKLNEEHPEEMQKIIDGII